MIEVIQYSKGVIKKIELNKYGRLELAWINVFNPNAKELESLKKDFSIPESILKHFLDNQEIPRIEKYKDYEIIILKFLTDKKVRTLGIAKHKNYVITVCHSDISIKPEKEFMSKDPDYFFKKIIDFLIKSFSSSLDKLEEEISYIEDTIFDDAKQKDSKKIFHLKKELMYIRKGLNANKEVIFNLDNIGNLKIELNQLIDTENTLTFRMTEIMNMYMMFVSNRLNEIMKSFTVIASLILLPSLVAGIYGMNLSLPFANKDSAFYIVVAMMFVSMILMIIYFKYKKWI